MARLNRNRFLFRLFATSFVVWVSATAVIAQDEMDEMDTLPLLQQALRFRVTIYKHPRPGFMTAAYHCRRASEGCDRRMEEFARYLNDAGERYGLDPWLLAAMAFRESGLNPWAVGAVGELGILQLHPRNPRSKNVRFVHDEWYRRRCHQEPGACQREVVERAAELLARAVGLCGGNLEQGLSMYNTGRCDGNRSYAQRVRGELLRLKGAVGLSVDERADDDVARNAAAQPDPETDSPQPTVADMVFGLDEAEANRDRALAPIVPAIAVPAAATVHTTAVHTSTAH
jgi:hypothetical protein